MAKKIVSYEVNCKIQFTKISCAEIRLNFIQKYINHANSIITCSEELRYDHATRTIATARTVSSVAGTITVACKRYFGLKKYI